MKIALKALSLALAITSLSCSLLSAGSIVSTSGTPSTNSAIAPSSTLLVQFTLGSAYSNVAISASLTTFTSGEMGTAFLTNQVGPGTTQAANQLGMDNFTFALVSDFTTLTNVALFSGMTLGPGTYDLTFTSPFDDAGISRNPASTYITASGVSVETFTAGTPNAYVPATTFVTPGQTLFVTVTGNQVAPEPASAVLLLTGLAALCRRRFRLSSLSNRQAKLPVPPYALGCGQRSGQKK